MEEQSCTFTLTKVTERSRTSIFHVSVRTFPHRCLRGILSFYHSNLLPRTPKASGSRASQQEVRSPGATSFVADVEGMGNILLRDQDGYLVAFEQFDCRSFARFPGKEVRATVFTYIDPFSCNRRNERCPPNYRSGRCRITRATGGSSTCFDNVHIVRELAIEL